MTRLLLALLLLPCTAPDEGVYVGVGYGGRRLVSKDGEAWEEGGRIDFKDWAFWFRRGVFGNGTFLLMGNHGKDQKAYWGVTTKDGSTVDHFETGLPVVAGLAFGAGQFVAVGAEGLVM